VAFRARPHSRHDRQAKGQCQGEYDDRHILLPTPGTTRCRLDENGMSNVMWRYGKNASHVEPEAEREAGECAYDFHIRERPCWLA